MSAVSVIIASHNRAAFLPRAVESAQASSNDVEVIVVDDASTDETADICRGISGIRYFRLKRNQRAAGTRNIGILKSTGDYLTFLDDDDVRLAGSLDLQVEALSSEPEAGLIYGQAFIADQNGLTRGDVYPDSCPQGDVFWKLLSENFIPCGTAVFRRACLFRVGLLDQSVPGVADWDLWIRIASLYQVMAVAQPVMVWRKSTPVSGQLSSHADVMATLSTDLFRQKWTRLNRVAEAPAWKRRQIRRQFSRNMASHLVFETARALVAGRFSGVQKNALAALRLHPYASVRAAATYTLRFLSVSARGRFPLADFAPGFMHGERTKSNR
jgi:hypothetical protein